MSSQRQLTRLIKKAQRGDKHAFEELYTLNFDRAYFIAYKMLGNQHEALEATQDVFEYVYTNLLKLREPVAFPKWFGLIVHNKCIDLLRGKTQISQYEISDLEQGIEERLIEEKTEFLPEEFLDSEENRKRISQLVDELPLAQRESVMMYYFEDLSGQEIAEITGTKPDTIYRRLSDARATLKKQLNITQDFETAGKAGSAAAAIPVLTRVLQEEATVESAAIKAAQHDILGKLVASPAPAATVGKAAALSPLTKGLIAAGAAVLIAGAGLAIYVGTTHDNAAIKAETSSPNVSEPRVVTPSSDATTPVEPVPLPPEVQETAPAAPAPQVYELVVTPAQTRPTITLAQRELYYPAGAVVPLATILAEAAPHAFDSAGNRLDVSASMYDYVDFYHPGAYVISLTAKDGAGLQADTAIITVVIQE